MMQASIETINGHAGVKLDMGNGVRVEFQTMEALANWADGLHGLTMAWRADNQFAGLAGLRRLVADAITQNMRDNLGEHASPLAAENFPEDVLFGGQWHIDVKLIEDRNHVQVTIEQHAKSLITTLADCIVVGAEKAAANVG